MILIHLFKKFWPFNLLDTVCDRVVMGFRTFLHHIQPSLQAQPQRSSGPGNGPAAKKKPGLSEKQMKDAFQFFDKVTTTVKHPNTAPQFTADPHCHPLFTANPKYCPFANGWPTNTAAYFQVPDRFFSRPTEFIFSGTLPFGLSRYCTLCKFLLKIWGVLV